MGVKPNPNWLPMTLFLGVPGPFTVELTQFSSTLIDYYLKLLLSREAKRTLASVAFNAMGGNNVILFLTRQHQIYGLHIQRQRGAVSLAWMLSPVRYIQHLAN